MSTQRNRALVSTLFCALLPALAGCDSGSSSGTPGTGGGTGSGGASGGDALIDDMEDGNGSIAEADGRVGAWYTYNDETKTATQTPTAGADFTMAAIDPARGESASAANTSGSGFTLWGAGMGFELNNAGTAKKTYDASAYSGIKFWAKVGPGGAKIMRVNVSDKQTDPAGGICKEASDECFDDFGAGATLTEEWKEISLPFASLKQEDFGKAFPAVDAANLYAVHFQVDANVKFDLWIDDVSFIE